MIGAAGSSWRRLAVAGEDGGGRGSGRGGVTMVPSPLFLSPSDDLHGPPFQQSSASAIENMNSHEENEKHKDGAKIQFCAIFALCAKTVQDYLRKLRLAPSVKHKVLRCPATKTTLVFAQLCAAKRAKFKNWPTLGHSPGEVACPNTGLLIDSHEQQGI